MIQYINRLHRWGGLKQTLTTETDWTGSVTARKYSAEIQRGNTAGKYSGEIQRGNTAGNG
jgi:hypothetical protein